MNFLTKRNFEQEIHTNAQDHEAHPKNGAEDEENDHVLDVKRLQTEKVIDRCGTVSERLFVSACEVAVWMS